MTVATFVRENMVLRRLWGSLVFARVRLTSSLRGARLRSVGRGCQIYSTARIYGGRHVALGDRVTINDFVHIWGTGGVVIGDDSMIAAHSAIVTGTHDIEAVRKGYKYRDTMSLRPVVIGKNVWIGTSATILPGVTIGDDAVVAAGAVVTKDVPPRTLVAGVPARSIRLLGGEPAAEEQRWVGPL
jgi:maltose O-acetyltransferase